MALIYSGLLETLSHCSCVQLCRHPGDDAGAGDKQRGARDNAPYADETLQQRLGGFGERCLRPFELFVPALLQTQRIFKLALPIVGGAGRSVSLRDARGDVSAC